MAEKITWIELRRRIAARAGGSQKEAATFMDELLKQIIAGLKTDKQVRITGLGTFKLQEVAPRKSVNVVTGEDIMIAGYDKLVFTPEAGIKELVASNSRQTGNTQTPAATEPTQSEITPLQKLGEQADEIVGLLADLGQPVNDIPAEPQTPQTTNTTETTTTTEPTETTNTTQTTETTETTQTTETTNTTQTPPPTPTPKYHFLRDTLITLVILLFVLAGAFLYFRYEVSNWVESLRFKQQTPIETVAPVKPDTTAITDTTDTTTTDTIATTDTITTTEPPTPTETTIPTQPAKEPEYYIPKTLVIRKGDGLMQIARRYYGHPDFWVFIYEANESRFKSPDSICWGTRIKMPQLTKEERDITNPETRQRIRELTNKYQ
jgi:nucleoid DNA-binding protein